ncbi:unnamed protein product [Albugo candida]|uniref:Uncharacterized protein n=1 Tax=Albugo candida TaxID=65357 RepID=A0A024FV75_9STRA|nr:unnamed protein product [Albugo candida]|eukprot:CCI10549.1 unnamed protein product [Albugo candida]
MSNVLVGARRSYSRRRSKRNRKTTRQQYRVLGCGDAKLSSSKTDQVLRCKAFCEPDNCIGPGNDCYRRHHRGISNRRKKNTSWEIRYWAITGGLPPTNQNYFPLHVNQADQSFAKRKRKEGKQLCAYRHNLSFSFLCEACILSKSESGSMERYVIDHVKRSVLYVIRSSDSHTVKNACVKPSVCSGTTATLSDKV